MEGCEVAGVEMKRQQVSVERDLARHRFSGRTAASLGLLNELGDSAEVESRAVEKARAMAAIPSRGFAVSQRMQTERQCATIGSGFPAQLEQYLDAWFGERPRACCGPPPTRSGGRRREAG
jgi:enoyl-CoA hydratase/carnithine racemase